jgi:hypothetical protein
MGERHKESSVIYVGIRIVATAHLFSSIQARSYLSEVKEQITDMAVNGSGMRDERKSAKN